MTATESSVTPTPKRSQLQLNANAPNLCSSSRIRLMAPTHPPLSPLNVNANGGNREHRGFVPPSVKKKPQTTNTNTRGDGKESEAVVWNNAVFRCDGVSGTQSSSTATSHSEAPEDRHNDFSRENHSPDIESTASTSIVALHNKQPEAASSSGYAERKHPLQSVKKSLFSTMDEGTQSNSGESIADANDPEIQEIEKEILRLTQKLGELRLQKVADRRDQPEGEQRRADPPPSSSVADETPGPDQPDHQRRRGRVVSAKFLQYSKIDRKLVETPRNNGNGRIQMSPDSRRKAASLGPSEHSRFVQLPGKPKENEFGIQFKVDSARKVGSSNRNVNGGETGKYDRTGNKMRSLSLSPTCHRIANEKMARSVSVTAKKPGIGSLKLSESKSSPWLHRKKLFQESEPNKSANASIPCVNSRGQPCQQVEKHSVDSRHARFVASRYGRILTPSKDKAAQTPICSSLSSLRNVHGKRHFQEDELEYMKGRLNYSASKKRSALGKNGSARNGYPSRSVSTQNSKAPQCLAANLGARNIGTPRRHNTRQAGNHSDLFQQGSSNRKVFTGDYQEKITGDGTENVSFSLGITEPPGMLQPNSLKLPRIKTMRFIAESPRDSGCVKRAVDRIGKKSFFASGGIRSSAAVDKRNGRSVDSKASSRKGFVLDIKPRLSFDDDEAGR